MALKNGINLGEIEEPLTKWLAYRLPYANNVRVTNVNIPNANGLSNETVLFEAAWQENGSERCEGMVARVSPTAGNGLFPSYNLKLEASVMQALGEYTSVPVPDLLFFEEDAQVFNLPFLIMRRVDGRIPPDEPPFTLKGWVLDLSPEEQQLLHDSALKTLVKIHNCDWESLNLNLLPRGLDYHLAYYEKFYEWACAKDEYIPTIEAAFDWVRTNRPLNESSLVLNWGDPRIPNMIFDDQLSVKAVLDWEMVSLAPPELDLAAWLFGMRHHTEFLGAPLPNGFPDRTAFIARYEELAGRAVRDLEFYDVFAALRAAVIFLRAGHLMIDAGVLPPDSMMCTNNPATQVLAELLSLPAPVGAVTSIVGRG